MKPMSQAQQQSLIQLKQDVWRDPRCFIAAGFGLGLLPLMPGTFATLGAVLVYLCIWQLHWLGYLVVLIVVTAVAIWLSHWCARRYQLHDPTAVCLDEFAGYLLTMFLVPTTVYYLLAGFVLFRFFDIAKPWVIGMVDRKMDSGFGMVLDDLLAGVFAWVVLQLVHITATLLPL